MLRLREYQTKAISDIRTFFGKGGNHCILQAPTGSGKTIIFSVLAKKTAEKHKKVLIMTDRDELLMQTGGAINRTGLNAFFIQAGQKYVSNDFNVYIAMSQTLRRRIDLEYWIKFLSGIDLLIIDECHKQEFNYLFESQIFNDKYVIGFTATPHRSGKMRQLALDYDKIISTISVKKLIEKGFLVNDDYYGISSPDMSNVKIDRLQGDYKPKEMFEKFDSPKLYSGLVENYKKIAPKSKTLIFCVNIEHCIKSTILLRDAGFTANFVVSSMNKPKYPKDPENKGQAARYNERMRVYELYKKYYELYSGKRTDIFNDFQNNKFQILINAGIATTGYDCPSIETIILNRATISVTLLLQMIGRGSRIFDKKTHFNIFDFGGNCERLGYYSEDRNWSLWHESKDGKGLPPLKECGFDSVGKPIEKGGCRRLILASYKICPFCGFKYPEKKTAKVIKLYSSLYKDGEIINHKRVSDMNFDELHDYWKLKGHKIAWLWRQLWYRGKKKAIENFAKKYGWQNSTIISAVKFCERF